ncbi:hypothetical protein ACFLW1_01250 [Chloroflexota bacterium]
MNNLVQETADREIIKAIGADEQANTNYYQVLKRFISSKSALPKEHRHQPDARLDAGGLKEIDTAWLLLQTTGKNLRRAYMKLYVASL